MVSHDNERVVGTERRHHASHIHRACGGIGIARAYDDTERGPVGAIRLNRFPPPPYGAGKKASAARDHKAVRHESHP